MGSVLTVSQTLHKVFGYFKRTHAKEIKRKNGYETVGGKRAIFCMFVNKQYLYHIWLISFI